MKLYPDCAACMLKRTYETTKLASKSEETRERVMSEILRLTANNFKPSMCPSVLGTLQSNLICALTKNSDPFREKKIHVIKKALACRKKFEKYVNEGKDERERFRRATLVAVCGNTIEISAPQHDVDVHELEREMFGCIKKGFAAKAAKFSNESSKCLAIDDVDKIFSRLKRNLPTANAHFSRSEKLRVRDILYICDNAGEAVFDVILIKEIKKYARVTIAVASGPVDDDITMREAGLAGLRRVAPVLAKGCCFGVWREMCTRAFWKKFKEADLIFAKGMGNYETLTEYPEIARGKSALLFKVKCTSVEKDVRAKKGSNVVMFY